MAEKVLVSIIALLLRCAVPVTPLSIAIGRGGVLNPRPATTTTTTLTTRGVGGRDVDGGVPGGGTTTSASSRGGTTTTSSSTFSSRSLASDYSIRIDRRRRSSSEYDEFAWELRPLVDRVPHLPVESSRSLLSDDECEACCLELRCRWSRLIPLPEYEYDNESSSWSIDVRTIVVEGGGEDVPGELSLVLARVAAQSAASEIARLVLPPPPDGGGRDEDRRRDDALLYVTLPLSDGEGCQKLRLSDLDDDNDVGVRRLFASMDDDDDDDRAERHSEAELVDMVDGEGTVLGSLPRPYVHAWNVLHRGVGLIVAKDEDVLRSIDDGRTTPMVYVHRRTSTKRIFPSLYDMFVGGVSCRGERSRTTAAREVAEELGLGRALDFVDGGGATMTGTATTTTTTIRGNDDPLSDELFKCTICTSYNRCVVSVFSYVARDVDEVISWQDEEVAWGGYVPYDVVEYSAYASINRLSNRGYWPGILPLPPSPPPTPTTTTTTPGEVSTWESNDDDDDDELRWDAWDFVPDGLLVWEAWKSFVRNRR